MFFVSFYTKHRTHSKKAEGNKIIGDRLYYEMFFKKGMKILDIGCSTGTFVLNDPKNIIGLDIDRDAIAIARKKGLNCRYYDINTKRLPFKDSTFDAVNLKSVLAHVHNGLFLLKEIRRVLHLKGKLVIFTASIKILKFKFFEDYTHVSPFTKESLSHILYDAGFGNYKVCHFPIRMFGMGFIYRNGILSAKGVYSIEKFIVNSPILSNIFLIFDKRVNLLAEAYK